MGEDPDFQELVQKYSLPLDNANKQIWICKPGENANRGKGIVVLPHLDAVRRFL